MRRLLEMFGYILYLFGAAFAGFPPPRSFEREQTPEEVMVRLLDDESPEEHDGVLSEWGFVVREPRAPGRSERPRPTRPTLTRAPRPPVRRRG